MQQSEMQQSYLQQQPFISIIQQYPQYRHRFLTLFHHSKHLSPHHLSLSIIINPNSILNLIESQDIHQLQTTCIEKHDQLVTMVTWAILLLLERFPFNCRIVLDEPYLLKENRKIDFLTYFIDQLYSCIHHHPQLVKLEKNLLGICDMMITNCHISKNDMHIITRQLSDSYYKGKLSLKLVETSYELFSKANHDKPNHPFLYFLGLPSEGVKVLLSNNKSTISKGITLCCWFKTFCSSECKIMHIRTEYNNQILVKIVKSALVVRFVYREKDSEASEEKVFDIQSNYINSLYVQLQANNQSLFSSTSYSLKVTLNNQQKTVTIKVPKFSNSEVITQLSWFHNLIGACYSIIVYNKTDTAITEQLAEFPVGICSEQLLANYLQSDSPMLQSIACILNAERAFEGILVSSAGDSQGCYQGGLINDKIAKKDVNHVNAILPYLYFVVLLEPSAERDSLFDRIVRRYLEWYNYDKSYHSKNFLFLLYFLQLTHYAISDQTLGYIQSHLAKDDDLYVSILLKYMDVHQLVNRKIKFAPTEIEINPVQKLQLLFYLESQWKTFWNQMQGFIGWWSPTFFKLQNNDKFTPEHYGYVDSQCLTEWSVRNFITNDYCKCFLEPIFKTPPYANLKYFAEEFRKKGIKKQSYNLDKLLFEKVAKSKLDYLRKIFKKSHHQAMSHENQRIQLKQQLKYKCCLIQLLSNIIGILKVTQNGEVIFVMTHDSNELDHMCVKSFKNEQFIRLNFNLKDVKLIRKRRYNQCNKTLEFRLYNGQIHLMFFYKGGIDEVLGVLESFVKIRKDPYNYYLASNETFDWIEKKKSNFEYLMWLNDASGRSYFDITQYPILPWITISNQHKLNSESQLAYRQLSKNMGSFGPQQRIKHFLQKYEAVDETEIFSQYHFGTHYSSAAIIFNYLIRIHPFSEGAVTLQSGKFDCADRVFGSYYGSWINATNSPTDVRELIPEIYTLPQVLINYNNYDFGTTQDKKRIDNVELPKWTGGNPYVFVIKLRQLLQSTFVEQNINHWIDLIFGYKQRGQQALKSMNIFFPLTYEDSIALDSIEDTEERKSYETQIAHFGQNPCQIIGSNPHPVRAKNLLHWEGKLLTDPKIQPTVQKFNVSKNYTKENQYIFNSVFEGKESIISVKFLSENWFIVIQKHQYCIFLMENKKENFITKQFHVQYNLEQGGLKMDYSNLVFFVPVCAVEEKIVLVGGFYSGHIQILFTSEHKFNQSVKLSSSTITALAYDNQYSYLYVGDSYGRMTVYQLTKQLKYLQFAKVHYLQAHSGRVNCFQANKKANLGCSCGQDGMVNIYNLYQFKIFRVIANPSGSAISLCTLSTCPLYSILFYAHQDGKIYSYSLNGQSLDVIQQKSGFLYNFTLLKSSNKLDFLAYVNPMKQLYIVEVPIFKIRRKIKIRKDENKVSCIECGSNSKVVITGSEDGYLHLVGDKSWF